ncbi:MAG: ATP-binding protein, partial [bacterium]
TRLKVSEEEAYIIQADGKRILQILVNLYSNAIRFSPVGGNVDTLIMRSESEVVVEISDEGPGIAPEDREVVFEKYRQLNRSSPERIKGSGLGLTIVKRLMDLHHGEIQLDDRDSARGSKFILRFPVTGKGV